MGVHYTPRLLAEFLAERIVHHLEPMQASRGLRILDPSCGDGALLEALLSTMSARDRRCTFDVVGVETDPRAIARAESRLSALDGARLTLVEGDFLDCAAADPERHTLWEAPPPAPGLPGGFDAVIANPPYVRTQVLGAEQARRLAARYRLAGRVDLYHAFFVAVTGVVKPGGIMGILTSNRFLSTLTGRTLRGFLAEHHDLLEVIDLGDTKLFEAAVLPAILVCRRRSGMGDRAKQRPRFTRIYADPDTAVEPARSARTATSVIEALRCGKSGTYRTPAGVFRLTSGHLALGPDPTQVWSLTSRDETAWLERVREAAWGRFEDVASVRVGIKTTADEVFIRSDWDALPPELRPEPELLHPLLTHEDACRWARPVAQAPAASILYPHRVVAGRRRPIELRDYPRAAAYLARHKARLEGRKYVLEAGRRWYEIWVPQDPAGWTEPKVVFPDISPEPRFYLDIDGHLVDGDCYWVTVRPGWPSRTLYLLMAIANSSLARRYHDLAFNNKLYSSRRRYLTQYVTQYPLPDPASSLSERIIRIAEEMHREAAAGQGRPDPARIRELDNLVYGVFGLRAEEGR
jgi:hypothetical protein